MDRKQLRTFVAVAEHRSFSAAARALGTVQSNVSAHVARLERDLGVTLIDRATSAPTPEGLTVLDRARRIEAEFQALGSDVASMRDVVVGSVQIGVIGTTARWLVPPLLVGMARDHPRVQVTVLDATTTSLALNLHSATIDLAVVNLPAEGPDVTVEPLFLEDRVLVAPRGHPLHDRDSVSLEELAAHELLLGTPGTSFRDVLDAAADELGVELRAKAEFDGMRLLASLAFAGFGAGIVPSSALPSSSDGTWRWIPVEGVPPRRVGLARRRHDLPSAAQRAATEAIRAAVAAAAPTVTGVQVLVGSEDDAAGR
jgi:LysR family hydrogen peroxide-inducible transcriptional activator